MWAQLPGRGLAPRLSIGTLQLSIRCSSIHFLPSRSFPVSGVDPFEGRRAAFGAAWLAGLSCADAANASAVASSAANAGLSKAPMTDLVDSGAAMRRTQQPIPSNYIGIWFATRNPRDSSRR
jgi:hypothetical protein